MSNDLARLNQTLSLYHTENAVIYVYAGLLWSNIENFTRIKCIP